MNKHQTKGLVISVLFLIVTVAAALFGLHLGRVLWILLFLFVIVSFVFYAAYVALREMRSKDF